MSLTNSRRFDAEFLGRWDRRPAADGTVPERTGEEALHVRAAGADVLLRLMEVREIVPFAPLAPLPGGPTHVLGLLNLRGEILTVLSLDGLLAGSGNARPGFVVVVEGAGIRFALAAEDVGHAVRAQRFSKVEAEANVGARAPGPSGGAALLWGTAWHLGRALPVLDVEGIAQAVFDTETLDETSLADGGTPR